MDKHEQKLKKEKMEFSKKLAITMTRLFTISFFFFLGVWFFQDRVSPELMTFIATPFGVVITGYFAKAGFENHSKINKSDEL